MNLRSTLTAGRWPDCSDVCETVALLRDPCQAISPRWGLVLGSGLSGLVDHLDIRAEFETSRFPNFPQPTAIGHGGRLILGFGRGVPVLAVGGRVHVYEGFSYEQVTFAVRLMRQLGITHLLVSNASGGLNPRLRSGDILIVEDHLDLMGQIRGVPPIPDGVRPFYEPRLIQLAANMGRRKQLRTAVGVYAAMSGPSYETRAEYRFLRAVGADVVGMSTVPEVVCAAALGMSTLALSVVTNICQPDTLGTTDGQSVVAAAAAAEPALRELVLGVLQES